MNPAVLELACLLAVEKISRIYVCSKWPVWSGVGGVWQQWVCKSQVSWYDYLGAQVHTATI